METRIEDGRETTGKGECETGEQGDKPDKVTRNKGTRG